MKGHWALFCFFFLTVLFIYSFLATLGLCCCTGFSLAAELRLLTSVASLVAEHGLSGCGARAQSLQSTGSVVAVHGLSRCGAWAQLRVGSSWGEGSEPVAPTLHMESLPLGHQESPGLSSEGSTQLWKGFRQEEP